MQVQPWLVLLYGGIFVLFCGTIWLYFQAIRSNPLWFLACLIFPPLLLVFAVLHSARSAMPALLCMIGGIVAYAAELGMGGQVFDEMVIGWALIVPTVVAESLGYRLPIP